MEVEVGHLRKRDYSHRGQEMGRCAWILGNPVQTSTCSGGNWGSEKKVMCPNSHSQLNPNEVPG